MKKSLMISLVAVILSGCAAQPDRVMQTQSGKPEGVFKNASASNVSSRLAQRCLQKGNRLDQQDTNRVVCRQTLQGGSAVMTQLLIGNSYSTTPDAVATYSLIQQGNNTRVYVDAHVETQMAFGQMQRMQVQDNATFNQFMEMLWELGAERPSGATARQRGMPPL